MAFIARIIMGTADRLRRILTRGQETYSQFGEDRDIWKFFKCAESGFFLDVGANDGYTGSNTYLLEKKGWTGVLIEPNPRLASICRTSRPNSWVIEIAAIGSPSVESVELHEYGGTIATGGRYDGWSSVGGPSRFEQLAIAGGATVERRVVAAATIDSILEKQAHVERIDFVSIDVEGLELEVLKGFSLDRHDVRLILVEDNSFGWDSTVMRYLRLQGYCRVHRTGVNDWYVAGCDVRHFRLRRVLLVIKLGVWRLVRALGE